MTEPARTTRSALRLARAPKNPSPDKAKKPLPRPAGADPWRVEATTLPPNMTEEDVRHFMNGPTFVQESQDPKADGWTTLSWLFMYPNKLTKAWIGPKAPPAEKHRWHVVAAGDAPEIEIEGEHFHLVACSHGKMATVCLAR